MNWNDSLKYAYTHTVHTNIPTKTRNFSQLNDWTRTINRIQSKLIASASIQFHLNGVRYSLGCINAVRALFVYLMLVSLVEGTNTLRDGEKWAKKMNQHRVGTARLFPVHFVATHKCNWTAMLVHRLIQLKFTLSIYLWLLYSISRLLTYSQWNIEAEQREADTLQSRIYSISITIFS